MIAVPLRIVTEAGVLSLLSTTMIFGTPLDVPLSELAVETFLPDDAAPGPHYGHYSKIERPWYP